MAIKDGRPTYTKITIDLSGPDGNAFCLMAYARQYGKQLGFSKEKIDKILNEMMMADYEGLINTFDKYFGAVIDLYRG